MNLEQEAEKITELLQGKSVSVVWRHRRNEVVIQFTDGTRLFIDGKDAPLDVSVTGGAQVSD